MKRSIGFPLNVATLPLILCRQVKTIKHGSVRINIVHSYIPIPCFLNFCSAVPTTFFSFLMIFLLVNIKIFTFLYNYPPNCGIELSKTICIVEKFKINSQQ